jgi:hypothetical protein
MLAPTAFMSTDGGALVSRVEQPGDRDVAKLLEIQHRGGLFQSLISGVVGNGYILLIAHAIVTRVVCVTPGLAQVRYVVNVPRSDRDERQGPKRRRDSVN